MCRPLAEGRRSLLMLLMLLLLLLLLLLPCQDGGRSGWRKAWRLSRWPTHEERVTLLGLADPEDPPQ